MSREAGFALLCLLLFVAWALSVAIDEGGDE